MVFKFERRARSYRRALSDLANDRFSVLEKTIKVSSHTTMRVTLTAVLLGMQYIANKYIHTIYYVTYASQTLRDPP